MLDEGTFEEWDAELEPADPLEFVDKKPYRDTAEDRAGADRAARRGRRRHAA